MNIQRSRHQGGPKGALDFCGLLGFLETRLDCLPALGIWVRRQTQNQWTAAASPVGLAACASPEYPSHQFTNQVRLYASKKGTGFLPECPFLSLVSGKAENLKVSCREFISK